MPFLIPPAESTIGDLTLCWWQRFAHGALAGGDGLFLETDRTDGGVFILCIDVSGHGPEVSPTVGLVHRCLDEPGCWNRSPAELLTQLHSRLAPRLAEAGEELFVEALAVWVDGASDGLLACRAGEFPNPWLRPPGGTWTAWPLPGDAYLGLPDLAPETPDTATEFPAGAGLLWFTDGIAHADPGAAEADANNNHFCDGPLASFLAGQASDLAARDLPPALVSAAEAHAQTGGLNDDTTVVHLRRIGSRPRGRSLPPGLGIVKGGSA